MNQKAEKMKLAMERAEVAVRLAQLELKEAEAAFTQAKLDYENGTVQVAFKKGRTLCETFMEEEGQ
jgi:hypothetical protein